MGTTHSSRGTGLVLTAIFLLSLFMAGCSSGTLAKGNTNSNPGAATPTPTPGASPSPAPPGPSPSPSPTPGPAPSPSPSPTPASGVPHSSHVVLVVDENTGYSTTAGQMTWLTGEGTAYSYAKNYVSNTSGSLMDYLWLASGSCESSACALPSGTNNFGCNGNNCSSPITDDSIWAEMDRLGISWRVYAQSYAAAGGTVTTPDNANGTSYYRRHNGATWYAEILNNVSGAQAKIVDFSQFALDLANNALPQFSWIVPDGLHDAHDGSPAQADAFLQSNVAPLLNQPYFQPGGDGLLIITFDNGDFDIAGPVYFAIMGPNVKQGYVSTTSYHHENTLRTMLDALGIAVHPGASATANAMVEFFK